MATPVEARTSVDVELFETIAEAVQFVASCGGGIVRVDPEANLATLYWESIAAAAEKMGVAIVPADNDSQSVVREAS